MKFRKACLFGSMFLMAVITFAIILFSSKSNMSYRVFHDHVVDLNSSNQIPELAEYEHVVLSNYSIDSLDYPNPNNDGTYRFCVYIIRKNGEHGERIELIVNKSRNPDLIVDLQEIVCSNDNSIDKPVIDGYIANALNHSSSNSLCIIPGECGIDNQTMLKRVVVILALFVSYMMLSVALLRRFGMKASKT